MEPVEQIIGDRTFVFKKGNALSQLSLLCKIRKLIGSDIAEALADIQSKGAEQIGIELILAATANMDEAKTLDVLKGLLANVVLVEDNMKSKRVDVNTDFEDVSDMFKVAVESFKVNFGGFLNGFLTISG